MADELAPAKAGDPGSGPGQALIDLIAPGGCDEANHGTVRYRVDNDGHVRVPREAAFWLIRNAGFRPAPPASTTPYWRRSGRQWGR
jgi:hypothetical protein